MFNILNVLEDKLTGKRVFFLIILASMVFFASLIISSSFYYSGKVFDWKNAVISDLQSPTENPQGYIIAALGTALTGIALAPTAIFFNTKLYKFSKIASSVGTIAFSLGVIGMFTIGCLTPFPKAYEPIHIPIAFATFITMVVSVLAYCILMAYIIFNQEKIVAGFLVILGVFQVVVLSALFYLFLTPGFFTNESLITTLALWEWLLCVSIVIYLLFLVRLIETKIIK